MKLGILAFIMFFIMTSASFADSNVYITQSGAALDLDITIDGNANAVGASNDRTLLTGDNLDVDIDLIGATNTIIGDFIGAGNSGSDDLKISQTGNTNATTLNVGASAATDDVRIIENREGSSGETTYTIGSAATVQDVTVTIDVVGDDIDIALTENSSSSGSDKTTDIDIATDSDDVDIIVTHTGAGAHKTKLLCTGACGTSDFTFNQTGANSTDVDLTVTNAAGSDVDIIITD